MALRYDGTAILDHAYLSAWDIQRLACFARAAYARPDNPMRGKYTFSGLGQYRIVTPAVMSYRTSSDGEIYGDFFRNS